MENGPQAVRVVKEMLLRPAVLAPQRAGKSIKGGSQRSTYSSPSTRFMAQKSPHMVQTPLSAGCEDAR